MLNYKVYLKEIIPIIERIENSILGKTLKDINIILTYQKLYKL